MTNARLSLGGSVVSLSIHNGVEFGLGILALGVYAAIKETPAILYAPTGRHRLLSCPAYSHMIPTQTCRQQCQPVLPGKNHKNKAVSCTRLHVTANTERISLDSFRQGLN